MQKNAAFPSRKLTDIGGQFPAWGWDSNMVHWAVGNAHVAYNLSEAKAFEVQKAADAKAKEEADKEESDDPEEEAEDKKEEEKSKRLRANRT